MPLCIVLLLLSIVVPLLLGGWACVVLLSVDDDGVCCIVVVPCALGAASGVVTDWAYAKPVPITSAAAVMAAVND